MSALSHVPRTVAITQAAANQVGTTGGYLAPIGALAVGRTVDGVPLDHQEHS